MLKQYDHIKLKSGENACVVEIWRQGEAYEADVEVAANEYETRTIRHADIESVFVEVETPLGGFAFA